MTTPDTLADIGVVRISDTPPPIGTDGDLWYNPLKGELSVSHLGAWVSSGGAGSLPEVEVSTTAPVGTNVLIWIDTSLPEIGVKYRTGAGWRTGLDGGRY